MICSVDKYDSLHAIIRFFMFGIILCASNLTSIELPIDPQAETLEVAVPADTAESIANLDSTTPQP